jgi:hypothetical protein
VYNKKKGTDETTRRKKQNNTWKEMLLYGHIIIKIQSYFFHPGVAIWLSKRFLEDVEIAIKRML